MLTFPKNMKNVKLGAPHVFSQQLQYTVDGLLPLLLSKLNTYSPTFKTFNSVSYSHFETELLKLISIR